MKSHRLHYIQEGQTHQCTWLSILFVSPDGSLLHAAKNVRLCWWRWQKKQWKKKKIHRCVDNVFCTAFIHWTFNNGTLCGSSYFQNINSSHPFGLTQTLSPLKYSFLMLYIAVFCSHRRLIFHSIFEFNMFVCSHADNMWWDEFSLSFFLSSFCNISRWQNTLQIQCLWLSIQRWHRFTFQW